MKLTNIVSRFSLLTACLLAPFAVIAEDQSWVDISNKNADVVLRSIAKYSPESAGSLGVDGLDEEIGDMRENVYERGIEDSEQILVELQKRLDAEKHPFVRQDIGILMKAVSDGIRSSKLQRENMLPYFNINQQMFNGIRALIDDQIPRERYPAAIVRINRYAGLEDGYQPFTELAKQRTEERFDVEGLQGPFRGEVEQDLERSDTFITGIKELMDGTDLQGWQEPYETLAAQMSEYKDWVRAEILPRARDDYRLPKAMYEDALSNWGRGRFARTPDRGRDPGLYGYSQRDDGHWQARCRGERLRIDRLS